MKSLNFKREKLKKNQIKFSILNGYHQLIIDSDGWVGGMNGGVIFEFFLH